MLEAIDKQLATFSSTRELDTLEGKQLADTLLDLRLERCAVR